MVVQFGSGGAVTLSSKPVRMGNVLRRITVYVLFEMNSDQNDFKLVWIVFIKKRFRETIEQEK